MTTSVADRTMTARYNGKCAMCGAPITAGDQIIYNSIARAARHPNCQSAQQSAPATMRKIRLSEDVRETIEDYLNNTVGIEHVRRQMAWDGRTTWNSPEHQAAVAALSASDVDAAITRVKRDL